MNDQGAKRLIAAILKRGYDDYTRNDGCPEWCPLTDTCDNKNIDNEFCDAKRFIHTTWCASLCEGIGLEQNRYIEQTITDSKMSKDTFKYIEAELRGYEATKQELYRMRRDMIDEGPVRDENGGGRPSGPGDPTYNKAARLLTNRKLQRLENVINSIGTIYNACDVDKQKLIRMKYWQDKYTDRGIMHELCIDRSTFYRWRRGIVYAIGKEMGYL